MITAHEYIEFLESRIKENTRHIELLAESLKGTVDYLSKLTNTVDELTNTVEELKIKVKILDADANE